MTINRDDVFLNREPRLKSIWKVFFPILILQISFLVKILQISCLFFFHFLKNNLSAPIPKQLSFMKINGLPNGWQDDEGFLANIRKSSNFSFMFFSYISCIYLFSFKYQVQLRTSWNKTITKKKKIDSDRKFIKDHQCLEVSGLNNILELRDYITCFNSGYVTNMDLNQNYNLQNRFITDNLFHNYVYWLLSFLNEIIIWPFWYS